MAFTPKAWKNDEAGGTPLNAAGLIDVEERLSDYTDAEVGTHAADSTSVHGIANTAALALKSEVATDAELVAEQEAREETDAELEAAIAGLTSADAVIFKGAYDASSNPNYPAADAGHLYRVSVAGKAGGASGVNVEVGDTLLCNTDSTAAGNQATVGAKWNVIQGNIDGAVVGPAGATDGHFARFDGTTGRLIKGGVALTTSSTLAGNSDANLPSEKAVKTFVETADGLLIPKSLVDAKGDLLTATANDTPARQAVGSNGQVLSAQSGESTGLKWIANNRIESHTFSTAAPTAAKLGGFFIQLASGEAAKLIGVRYRTDSGTCKLKVIRTTSGGTTTEPFKEKEASSTAAEQTPGTELATNDYLACTVESVSSPTFLVVTFFIERTRS